MKKLLTILSLSALLMTTAAYAAPEAQKIAVVDIQKVVIVASGSSYHCARYAADLFGNVAGIEARAIYSSEFLLKAAVPHENDILYVFITQSGETSDTNSALKKAKELGMRTLCITNKKGKST